MGLRTCTDENVTCLYDSTVGIAFGPTFVAEGSEEQAELFCRWYDQEFRTDIRADWFSGATALVMERFGRWMKATCDEMTGEWNQSVAESMVRNHVR